MSFCGSRQGSLSVKDGVLKNKCFVDVMNIIPHGLLLIVSTMILIAWRESIMGQLKAKTWVHFKCHSVRWIFTISLILISAMEIIEGVVSDYIDPDSVNYHVIVPPCFAFVSSIVSLVLYHNIEMWNSPRFLLILLPYWMCSCGLKLLKVFSLYKNGINLGHLRLWICWAIIFNYLVLTAVELAVLFTQRYAFFKNPRKVHPAPGLAKTRYYASFANFFSQATFWWIGDVLIEGFKSPMTIEQLGKLPHSDKTATNYKKLLRVFEIETAKAAAKEKQPTLHKIYLKAFWPKLVFAGLFKLLGDLLAFVGPWCIEGIVNYAYAALAEKENRTASANPTTTSSTSYIPTNASNLTIDGTSNPQLPEFYVAVESFVSNGFGLCVLLLIATLFQHTLLQNHHFFVIREGVRIRSAIQAMVYTKALRLSSLAITNGKMTIGQIINHMSMDANFIMMQMFFLHYIWAIPVQVLICMILMYYKLGISAILGGLVIILSAPVHLFLGRGMSMQQKKVMQCADARVKQCNEMVQGIKVIKLLSWETHIANGISVSRSLELKALMRNAVYRALYTFTGTALPALATLLTFVLYHYIEDEPLMAGKVLSTLALFNILTVPLVLFSIMTSTMIMANVSAKRLIPYFLAPEVEEVMTNVSDSIKTGAESCLGDGMAENHDPSHVELKVLTGKDKHDSMNISTCSLASHHSHTDRRSRPSSSSSLYDFATDNQYVNSAKDSDESSSQSESSDAESETAVALSPNVEHYHNYNQKHRHQSSASNEESMDMEPQQAVEVENGSFSWNLDTKEATLKNLHVQVPQGKLIMVVGPVGSGKTSLLSALLGEMLTVSGKVTWCRNASIAYVSQKPWLLNKTMQDNILFGSNFSWRRYQKVIESCALQPDIDMLPAGDQTEIGEKGVNLSGGQKQRVCIARALYSSADIIIMDDPFSALDAHVGRHVFDEVIMKKFMRRRKTVILVTHQLQYLSSAHSVLVMKEGEIEFQGKLSDVKKTNPDLYDSWRKALKEAKTAETTTRKDSEKLLDGTIDHLPARQISEISAFSSDGEQPSPTKEPNGKMSVTRSTSSHECETVAEEPEGKEEEDEDKDNSGDEKVTGKLIKKEHREVGSIKFSVYLSHLAACGVPFVVTAFLVLVANQGLLISTNIWISHWASKSTIFVNQHAGLVSSSNATSKEVFDNNPYIIVYVILSLSAIVITLVSGLTIQFTGVRGARNLHRDLLHTVMRVPVRFFDTNPSGRIVNRFSSDVGQIDQKIPNLWESFLRVALSTLAAIIVNCIGTPYFLLAAVPVCVLYVCLQKFYTATARELQRLESVTKSPVFSHFSETLAGLQTIRAYKAQTRFRHLAITAIDTNVVPFLFNQTANRWLGVRLDYMGAVLVFASAASSLAAGLAGNTDPAFIGLCIAYALMVSNYLNWIVRNSTELEMMMNAVERVEEYKHLKTESTPAVEVKKAECWPSEGRIEFKQVSLCYDLNQDPVVNNVSFSIQSGEKIGICGRTGSGKSSLTLSLFRMIEISQGEITIDDVNIAHVPLSELRSKLAIIPQDPILFTGTIRYNLDPTKEIEDNKLWQALDSVQLKEFIESLPDQLDASVSEGGENFSIGQKQLFCLARAFLRENKILVLDEATASIDLETDNKLQTVISTVFKNKTVITIAHRISTIMKYDRVMTMENGHMMEFDSPKSLMQDDKSYFAQLVNQSYK